MIKINETDRIRLLSEIETVRVAVADLKRDLKTMRYFTVEFEDGSVETLSEEQVEIVTDPTLIKKGLAIGKWICI